MVLARQGTDLADQGVIVEDMRHAILCNQDEVRRDGQGQVKQMRLGHNVAGPVGSDLRRDLHILQFDLDVCWQDQNPDLTGRKSRDPRALRYLEGCMSGVLIQRRIASGVCAQFHQLLGQKRLIAPLAPTRFCARRAPTFALVLNKLFKVGGNRNLLRVGR